VCVQEDGQGHERFAAAIDAFADEENWWNRLWAPAPSQTGHFDPKKQGTFPIVHGVRSLALRHHLRETSTAARLDALVAAGQMERELATDVLESLNYFMRLKLQAGLDELDRGQPVSGSVDLGRLGSLDRDLLKDTLDVVKRFRRTLRARFHLDAL
jgi:CBS domain-containing protein